MLSMERVLVNSDLKLESQGTTAFKSRKVPKNGQQRGVSSSGADLLVESKI